MPGRPRGRFKNLDDRQRKALARYLIARIDYLRAERKYTQQVLDALQEPARGDNKRMRVFLAEELAPARGRMRDAQMSAVAESTDVDALSEVIPAIVGGLGRAVDIPMLLAALNIDADLTGQAVAKAAPILKRIASRGSTNRNAAG